MENMFRFLIPLTLALSSATSFQNIALPQRRFSPKGQVASESQVKFALENRYDDTGPGAKQPEYAYNTYSNLEDALIAYLDDPDTKLPKHERERVIRKLTQTMQYTAPSAGPLYNKNHNLKVLEKPQFRPLNHDTFSYNIGRPPYPEEGKVVMTKGFDGNYVLSAYQDDKKLEPFRFHKIQSIKGSPLNLAHFSRDRDLGAAYEQFHSYPKYTFSYGVHDKNTGDSKSAQESRDGGTVHGFYSLLEADGNTRTVHYTADDLRGFRANVKKIH